jgi:hypothetical protein
MTISMLDQMFLNLSCGHPVFLGRLQNQRDWTCACGKQTELSAEPYKGRLAKDLDTAQQIDLQQKAKGRTITRLA